MVHRSLTKKNSSLGRSMIGFSDRDMGKCFVGSITKRGKRQKALTFFYYLLYSIHRMYTVDSFKFLRLVLENARPKVFLSSKKIAGVVHKIPTPISVAKSYSIIIHWVILSAKKRKNSGTFGQALFEEINDMYKNANNSTLKKRDEFHKLAYMNKPFLRYYKFLSMISFFYFKRQGRNNTGRITVRHRGSGIRFVKPNYTYFRSPNKEFKLTTSGFYFDRAVSARISPFGFSNSKLDKFHVYFTKFSSKVVRPVFEFSIGQFMCDIEIRPGSGPVLCRAIGVYSQLLKKRGTYATIRLSSGEIRRISVFCRARTWDSDDEKILNFRSQFQHSVSNSKKAGFNRLLGIRPHVRGCAINPVDHPHGGRTGDSRPSVSPWAQLTKGYRTRFKKVNDKVVLASVQSMKDKRRQSHAR